MTQLRPPLPASDDWCQPDERRLGMPPGHEILWPEQDPNLMKVYLWPVDRPIPVAQVRELGFEKRPSIPIRDFTPPHIDALPGALARAFEGAAAEAQQA